MADVAGVGPLMSEPPHVMRIGDGVYLVEEDGRHELVYVVGSGADVWAFSNGDVYRGDFGAKQTAARRSARVTGPQALTAPMPATVIKVLVQPGDAVKKGDTVILLEAMKMELPLRAPADATVIAVHCRQGELVQHDTTLIELDS